MYPIKDTKLITPGLLFAANKYNIGKLVKICIEHLKSNLSVDNALDILLAADQTNKDDLLEASKDFIKRNVGNLVMTDDFKEKLKNHPTLIANLLSDAICLK